MMQARQMMTQRYWMMAANMGRQNLSMTYFQRMAFSGCDPSTATHQTLIDMKAKL